MSGKEVTIGSGHRVIVPEYPKLEVKSLPEGGWVCFDELRLIKEPAVVVAARIAIHKHKKGNKNGR